MIRFFLDHDTFLINRIEKNFANNYTEYYKNSVNR